MKFTVSICILLICSSSALATPTVISNTISWPDNGWYQVQDELTHTEVCGGTPSCTVAPGSYVVINHSTGERFNGIVVSEPSNSQPINVTGRVISWPDDGWYQVQDSTTHVEVCGGGQACTVVPGSYTVINHSTGERFSNIIVEGASPIDFPIAISGNTISWPDDGWYQVQDADTHAQVCEGGRSCLVPAGVYVVINHSRGIRYRGITVESQPLPDPDQVHLQRVTFEITVPFYLSNELSVELIWGEIRLTSMWVGGQFWSATGEFPTETEHPLTITFYDNNGAVELAKYSQEFRAGSNATESVQILAEQFDATQFDSDGDGVSNLSELNAGTDPLVDEDSVLEIFDAFAISDSRSQYSRISVAEIIESRLRQDRPYIDVFEASSDFTRTLFGNFNISIDTDGNGTLDVNGNRAPGRFIPRLSATRTNLESSISWSGVLTTSDSEYVHREIVTNTVSIVDEKLRSFVEEVTGSNFGAYQFSWEKSANLIGRIIEGSSLCKPVAGTFMVTRRSNYLDGSVVVTTVSKEIDDRYWKVVRVTNDVATREYFARELKILNRPDFPESAFFICDFVDF